MKTEDAIKVLTDMINRNITPDEALKYTQAALNLAHVEATLANVRKNMS